LLKTHRFEQLRARWIAGKGILAIDSHPPKRVRRLSEEWWSMQSVKNLLAAGRFSATKLLAAVAISTFAGASASQGALIPNGSTFDISVVGFTGMNATGTEVVLVPNIIATFGSPSTGPAQGSQTATVISAESIVGGQTLDKVMISVPTNFDINDTTVSGQPIDGIFVQIGEALDATFGPVTQNGLQLSIPISPSSESSSGTANSTVSGTIAIIPPPPVTFNGTDTAMYAYEGVQLVPTGDIFPNGINSFTFISSVPEPMSGGILAMMAGTSLLRRRRQI
jgi:hypothetical protein